MIKPINNKKYIEKLLVSKRFDKVKNKFKNLHASEAAELIKEIEPEFQLAVYRLLPKKFTAKIFSYFEPSLQEFFISSLRTKEIIDLLAEIEPDDRTSLFEELPEEIASPLLKLLNPNDLKQLKKIFSYPKESVGRVMTPEFISVNSEWTAKETIDYIREKAKDKETIDVIYCTDNEGRLVREIPLSNLILAKSDKKIKDIHVKPLVILSAFEDQEKAVYVIKKYNRTALPVVDPQSRLVGIVTIDDLMDIQEEETTEDFHKFGGVLSGKGDSVFMGNILDASVIFLYKHRIFWLMLLIFVNIFSGAAIARFEEVIARSLVLVLFLPLLIDSGGNAGSQAAILMVRALGTGDVKIKDWFKLIKRELIISLLLGITMAFGAGAIGAIRGGQQIALVVGISMILIVVSGSLIGMSLPFIFTKLKRDPASASGPLVTSIADISGVIIYFSIANFIL